jgi:hypothetical protein
MTLKKLRYFFHFFLNIETNPYFLSVGTMEGPYLDYQKVLRTRLWLYIYKYSSEALKIQHIHDPWLISTTFIASSPLSSCSIFSHLLIHGMTLFTYTNIAQAIEQHPILPFNLTSPPSSLPYHPMLQTTHNFTTQHSLETTLQTQSMVCSYVGVMFPLNFVNNV